MWIQSSFIKSLKMLFLFYKIHVELFEELKIFISPIWLGTIFFFHFCNVIQIIEKMSKKSLTHYILNCINKV